MLKEKEKMKNLIEILNKATEAYNRGEPYMSDKDWDEKYFELVNLERKTNIYLSDSPTQKINYQVVNELEKVKHNHFMGSLAKTKEWDEFVRYFTNINVSEDVVGMLKLDGLTCSLRYIDGKLVSAETRGDGEVGENILHNALVIKSIPNKIDYKDELIIDGEIICTYNDFKEFENDYKNPRNFASGSIRLLDSKECATRNLTFVAWYVVKGLSDSLLDNFIDLQRLGFTVTPYTSSFDWDAKEFLQERAIEFGYPIDGLVGRFKSRKFGESLGATDHHRKDGYAFKFYDEEYETNLVGIEFEPSRNGQLTPVAIFEPVDTGDSVVERASLHNLSIMEELLGTYPEQKQKVWVAKMNDIIPQIVRAEKNHTQHGHILKIGDYCPICYHKATTRISDSGVKTLWCTNDSCEGKLINKLEHIFGKGKIEIKGLSKATFEKLIELGWIKSPRDIYEVLPNKQKEWKTLPGFGERSVANIIEAIEISKHCSLEQVICGAGIPLVGGVVSKVLAKEFKTWDNFRKAIKEGYKFYNLEGFGIEMHSAIVNFNYSEIDYIVEKFLTIKEEEQNNDNSSLKGITFCITGKVKIWKNRDELKSYIESLGGKVVGSMSSKVNYLINNDSTSQTAKNKAAIAAGIPILTEDDFVAKFK